MEILERSKEVNAAKAVRYVGSQPHAIHGTAGLPEVLASCASVYVARLIVIFATFAVPCVGLTEGDEACDVNLRAERLIRAQDGVESFLRNIH